MKIAVLVLATFGLCVIVLLSTISFVSRAELAVFLRWQYETIAQKEAVGCDTPFADINNIPENQRRAIEFLYYNKITSGTGADTFSPARRAGFVDSLVLLARTWQKIGYARR